MPTQPPSDSREARRSLVDTLRLDLIGPGNGHECAQEILPESPRQWYLTGYLVPAQAPAEEQESGDTNDELDLFQAPNGEDPDQGAEPREDIKSLQPSSFGLTVLTRPETKFTITARWGDYHVEEPETGEGEHLPLEDEQGGAGEEEGNGQSHPGRRYHREPGEGTVMVSFEDFQPNVPRSDFPPVDGVGLRVTMVLRPLVNAAALGLPPDTHALTVFLVNDRRKPYLDHQYKGNAFQVELEIESSNRLIPQPDLRGLGHMDHSDWDARLADLQYRDIHDFAVGHGIATVSEIGSDGGCRKVRTTWIPEHEVERVAPNLDILHVEFGMQALGEVTDGTSLKNALLPLVAAYRAWIVEQEQSATGLSAARAATAAEAISKARTAADRIEGGIQRIAGDPDALKAFRIANRAITSAASRRLGVAPGELRWRPFQLAFILLNAGGIVDPGHPDREEVDLLFFPTGGGKTEAYLGLAAFSMVLRRLRHPGIQSAGLSVLMRYTLRLLTLDQLGRAAGVICALELEREKDGSLGTWPFEIGLWVGSAATPNFIGGQGYNGPGAEHSAYRRVSRFRGNTSTPSPIPIEECPWCGAKFGRNSFKFLPRETYPHAKDLRIRCENLECEFNGNLRNLPILTVDEPIYRRIPAFIIATVDKFAALPWNGKVGALFGHVTHYDQQGFYGADDQVQGTPLHESLPGIDLVIQDELHLISGPLGTVAAIYETALEALACRTAGDQEIKPKIVASTATVRQASQQIRALFGRPRSAIFPPQGPDLRDTFFSFTCPVTETNGRLYVGIAAQGRSQKVVLMRTALALLCAAKKLYDECGGDIAGNPLDPYMTLLGYFNNLRELGGSRRIIEDEVVSRAQDRASRLRIAPQLVEFANREVAYEPKELTSRVSTAEVATTKRLLARAFPEIGGNESAVDVALATNMISVGLDIERLGLMVVLGQPKGSAEYIQATSRVGRKDERPGLVLTLYNIHRPRDRSHYEHFRMYHQTFYRAVEATGVTPFSPRALDRALSAALVGLVRHLEPLFTPNAGAAQANANRAALSRFSQIFARRAQEHREMDPVESGPLYDHVLQMCQHLFDEWARLDQDRRAVGVELKYTNANPCLLHDFLDENLPAPTQRYEKFRANRSMRNVEPNVELLPSDLDE